jgi:hypothetical protein
MVLEKALPCLFYLENRSSEAIIYHILHRGMELREGNKQFTKHLIREVERIVNQEMFGEPRLPSNWQFPLKDDGTIGDIKLANWHARRIVDRIDSKAQYCIIDATNRDQWMEAFTAYKNTIQVS